MPAAPKQAITTRLDEQALKIVDRTMERLAVENPHWPQVTRSDAIRHIIVSSGMAAAPTGKPPDPNKPMRSPP